MQQRNGGLVSCGMLESNFYKLCKNANKYNLMFK